MKKISLLLILTLIISAGCNLVKSEEEASERLVGYWKNIISEDEGGVTAKRIYNFGDNGRYRSRVYHYNKDGELLGFRVYEEGEYILNGNQLEIGESSVYASEDGVLYPSIQELKNSTSPYSVSKAKYRTKFENDDLKVTLYYQFYYQCPPNTLCEEPLVFKKLGVIHN